MRLPAAAHRLHIEADREVESPAAAFRSAPGPAVMVVARPVPYQLATLFQQRCVADLAAEAAAPRLLLLRHPPVATLGRNAAAPENLPSGIPVAPTRRGGQVTLHGPGQVVGYLFADLRRERETVAGFVRGLETLIEEVARAHGVAAHTIPGRTGLWTTRGKLGSIGIAVRRGVTWHGFALNVSDQAALFGRVPPCGLDHVRPDHLARYGPITWAEAATAAASAFTKRHGPCLRLTGDPDDLARAIRGLG